MSAGASSELMVQAESLSAPVIGELIPGAGSSLELTHYRTLWNRDRRASLRERLASHDILNQRGRILTCACVGGLVWLAAPGSMPPLAMGKKLCIEKT